MWPLRTFCGIVFVSKTILDQNTKIKNGGFAENIFQGISCYLIVLGPRLLHKVFTVHKEIKVAIIANILLYSKSLSDYSWPN